MNTPLPDSTANTNIVSSNGEKNSEAAESATGADGLLKGVIMHFLQSWEHPYQECKVQSLFLINWISVNLWPQFYYKFLLQ